MNYDLPYDSLTTACEHNLGEPKRHFFNIWRQHKEEIKAMGYKLTKHNGRFILYHPLFPTTSLSHFINNV